jgi:hypothetical protein
MGMMHLVASSQQVDLSEGNLRLVMIWAGVLIAAVLLAMIPFLIARIRRHRQGDTILAGAIIWGLLAAVSVGSAIGAQIAWEKEYRLRVETGYYDPRTKGDAPLLPWMRWGLLGLGYGVLVVWSGVGPARNVRGSGV